jgi:ATP-dependent DNA ligase
VNAGGNLTLFSRRKKSFNRQYPLIFEALAELPDNTVLDGEIVALNGSGRPDFSLLQHYRAGASHIHYFVFDLLVYEGRDLTRLPLIERRHLLRSVMKFSSPRIRIAEYFETSVENMLAAARAQGLERIVAKKKDGRYEAGKRSGSWVKYRLNAGQELVIGGYIPGTRGLDAIVVGYYKDKELIYLRVTDNSVNVQFSKSRNACAFLSVTRKSCISTQCFRNSV